MISFFFSKMVIVDLLFKYWTIQFLNMWTEKRFATLDLLSCSSESDFATHLPLQKFLQAHGTNICNEIVFFSCSSQNVFATKSYFSVAPQMNAEHTRKKVRRWQSASRTMLKDGWVMVRRKGEHGSARMRRPWWESRMTGKRSRGPSVDRVSA